MERGEKAVAVAAALFTGLRTDGCRRTDPGFRPGHAGGAKKARPVQYGSRFHF